MAGLTHPEYLVPSIIALVLALYPLPWHFRSRNIATLSMIFWMTLLNIVHIVNSVVWADDSEQRANWWGDICALIVVAYNFALPVAHLVLAKQLESLTSLRPHSPLYDNSSRRRHKLFDVVVSIAAPVVGVLLHLSNMDRRFYVVESFGPLPATYWDAWGVVWMAVVPIVIAAACATYTIMALVNIHLRRQQMLSLIVSDSSVNREQFYRLMFLTLAELGTCGLRAIFNLMSFHNGPQPMGHLGSPVHNLTKVESIDLSSVSSSGMLVLRLSFFTVIACSYVFFLCFATSTETKRFYYDVVQRVLPCFIPTNRSRMTHLGSIDSGLSRSNPTGTYSSGNSALSPTTPKDTDISLEAMLGAPRVDRQERDWERSGRNPFAPSLKTNEGDGYDEEATDVLYLSSMQTGNKAMV